MGPGSWEAASGVAGGGRPGGGPGARWPGAGLGVGRPGAAGVPEGPLPGASGAGARRCLPWPWGSAGLRRAWPGGNPAQNVQKTDQGYSFEIVWDQCLNSFEIVLK